MEANPFKFSATQHSGIVCHGSEMCAFIPSFCFPTCAKVPVCDTYLPFIRSGFPQSISESGNFCSLVKTFFFYNI